MDGSDPATDWQRLLSVDETPASAQSRERLALQHQQLAVARRRARAARSRRTTRRTWTAAARSPRGMHAIRVLEDKKDFTLDSLIAAAYDSYLTAFAELIPPLAQGVRRDCRRESAEGEARRSDRAAARLGLPLVGTSVPTSLAVFWGEELGAASRADARRAGMPSTITWRQRDDADAAAAGARTPRPTSSRADFGTWKTPWGDINRFQRLTGDIVQPFNDAGRASRSASRRRAGDRSRRSARAPITGPRRCTARAATASSRSSSSATACARRRSPPAARAATRRRRTSTIRRSGTRAGTSRGVLLPVAAQGPHRTDLPPGRDGEPVASAFRRTTAGRLKPAATGLCCPR